MFLILVAFSLEPLGNLLKQSKDIMQFDFFTKTPQSQSS